MNSKKDNIPRFSRVKEDFTCEQCGASVVGNGFTNHCPHCLWSKHVDVHPGDRAATCRGLMQPIGVKKDQRGYVITHRCTVCGFEKNQTSVKADSFDALISVAKGPFCSK